MGFFGNKDSKANKEPAISKEVLPVENKVSEASKNQLFSPQPVPAKNVFEELSANYKGVCETVKKQTRQWLDSPEIKEVNRWRSLFADEICNPISNIYRSLPENMTKLKTYTFGKCSFKERLFILQALTLLAALSTFSRKRSQYGAVNRLLYSTRNAAIAYLLGGLLVAPEIYNPLIKSDF